MSEDAAKEVSPDWRTRLTGIVDKTHLIYLGLLPCLATVAVLRIYSFPLPFLLFLFGVAGVGIYLAVTWSYTPAPRSLFGGLWMLLDGPLFVLLGGRGEQVVPLVEHGSVGDVVPGPAGEHVGERALPGAVGAHDGVHLSSPHGQVEAAQNVFVPGPDVEVSDLEHRFGLPSRWVHVGGSRTPRWTIQQGE